MVRFRYPRHSDVANRKATLSVLVQKMVPSVFISNFSESLFYHLLGVAFRSKECLQFFNTPRAGKGSYRYLIQVKLTLIFLCISIAQINFDKQRRKAFIDLDPKSFLWTSKQLFAIHFLLATRNVCPLAMPEFFPHNLDIWLLANHSLHFRE